MYIRIKKNKYNMMIEKYNKNRIIRNYKFYEVYFYIII